MRSGCSKGPAVSDELTRLATRVTALEDGQEQLRRKVDDNTRSLDENTRLTREVRDNTTAIVAAFQAAQGAFLVAEWAGKAAKVVASIGAAVVVVWGAIKGVGKFGA